MECLYSQEISDEKNSITITGSELKHVKALRLQQNEKVLITNGLGVTCLCELFQLDKDRAEFLILDRYEYMNEDEYNTALAIGLIAARDRFEFAIEKAVELGVVKIIPLYSKFTQKFKYKQNRTEAKILAAMKQSKRSILPELTEPLKFSALLKELDNFDTVIVFDEKGQKPDAKPLGDNILVLIGPEGGFDEDEIKILSETDKTMIWTLGKRRQRSETAAISGLSIVNYLKSH